MPRNIPTHEDFKACFKQNEKSFIKLNGVDAIVIDKHHAVSFAKPLKYKKYDRILKLFVIYCEEELKPPKFANDALQKKELYLGSLTQKRIAFGKFKKQGSIFSGFDTLFFKDRKGSMIVDGCCFMHGIGRGNGSFIPNRYLKRLLESEDNFYGDIGIGYYGSRGKVFISSLNPYKVKNLCIGDEIVSVNGIPVDSKAKLQEMILFSKKDDVLTLYVKRGGKMRVVEVKPFLRGKYPYRDSTYLKQTGMIFGKHLVLSKVPKNSFAAKKGLKGGDKLMEVNFKPVKTTYEMRRALRKAGNSTNHLLFTRKDFQFFITFKPKDVKGGLLAFSNCP